MRICIVAEHASYRFGGEAILPIHYFARLRARGQEAWLVVHARTREELEAAFPSDRHRLRFVEDAWFHRLLARMSAALPGRLSGSTVSLLSLLITQYLARKIVLRLRDTEGLDIVHQPIPVSPRFPSLMFGLGLPVIIGPMNGGMNYPSGFQHAESLLTRLSVRIGRYFSNFANSVLPGKKLATVLLVANGRTRLALPQGCKGRIVDLPENGVDLNLWSALERGHEQSPIGKAERFIFVGRLVDWKCLDVVLEALRRVPDAHLEIIGDGTMREPWKHLAEELGVSSRVLFSGWLTQTETAKRMQSAIALLLPSIYESGGAVILEAMACGLPVIATEWGGPVDYIDNETGILIEPKNRSLLIEGFAVAMCQLVAAPELARKMGRTGRRKVEQEFDWDKKINAILRIYREAATIIA